MKNSRKYVWIILMLILEISSIYNSISTESGKLDVILFMWIALWGAALYFSIYAKNRVHKIAVKNIITGIPDGGTGSHMMDDISKKEKRIHQQREYFMNNWNLALVAAIILINLILYILVS